MNRRFAAGAFVILMALAPARGYGQAPDTTRTVTVGAFVDTYYAWDFNRPGPGNFDRSFTTQPARHDEFNVNLAHVELKLSSARTRGRLALQAGTSVQSNYAGEPRLGSIAGPDLARHIQEAVVGVRAASNLWIDAGIYLSHIGQESWISRDNPTYSRSLIADYSPYYETGVKATWTASPKVTAQLHVVNGWQNISETNLEKAVGLRLDYVASPHLTVGYDNFIGDEMSDTLDSRVRIFNEAFALISAGKATLWLTFDYGAQARKPASGYSTWYGGAAIARVKVSSKASISVRLERYWDPDGVIISTGTPNAFRVNGGSFNIDVAPFDGALWRTEVRGYMATDPIFPRHGSGAGFNDRNGFLVTSLAVTL
jgi:hypothetical protein